MQIPNWGDGHNARERPKEGGGVMYRMHCLIPPTRLGWHTKRSNLLVPTLVGKAPLVQKGMVDKITTCIIQVKIHIGSE